jgi:hypothetical protein
MKQQKKELYKVTLTGPGHSFDRGISESTAQQIISLVMGRVVHVVHSTADRKNGPGEALIETNLTPKQFLAAKRPETNYERMACLAYYLTRMRNTSQFKTRELSELNTEAAQPRLSNAAVFVTDATSKYQYLSAAGGGKKQITARGEALVDALPDREAVQRALDEHPIGGRRKAKNAKKSKKVK